jgi:nucleoside-diphosphate-sugar epimerase
MAIQLFLQKIRNGVPIEVTGDGTQIRDITFVDDIVDGTILASTLDSEKSCFNLSGGNIYSVNEILKTCFQVVGKKVPIKYIDRPKGDQDSTIGDSTLAIQSLGFRPKVNIEEGITAQYEYLCRYT